ncbi:MIP/aquaporin family protein [Paenibacillus methanolicus]|uniref:Aquaporin Z n=1 Tax=Paenibacillus methanolicus TaxID=582686 RepID=A0A5S5BTN9_9BACL|nr:aquaporin [Paenibacillus methanolicus]TYP68953.1 aquaporin Z [Paenibacillus methanolicus]
MNRTWRKYAAEGAGTFVLVLFGCGSAATAGGNLGSLGVALSFGLSLIAMMYVIGPVSGCHVNPAVSMAMFLQGKLSGRDLGGYIAAQLVGGILASGLLYAIIESTGKAVTDLGQNGYGAGYGIGITASMAIVVEIILTFVFVYTLLGVTATEATSKIAGIVIGLTLTFVHILGIGLTGTSVNPARSLGPALWLGGDALHELWVFIFAPLIGSVVAVWVFRRLYGRK